MVRSMVSKEPFMVLFMVRKLGHPRKVQNFVSDQTFLSTIIRYIMHNLNPFDDTQKRIALYPASDPNSLIQGGHGLVPQPGKRAISIQRTSLNRS